MCCIDVDPIEFLKWAKPVLEKKDAIRAEVRAEIAAENEAYNSLPWYRKMLTTPPGEGFDRYFYVDRKLMRRDFFILPTVNKDKYIPLASYCVAKGIKMPLDSGHDFFKG